MEAEGESVSWWLLLVGRVCVRVLGIVVEDSVVESLHVMACSVGDTPLWGWEREEEEEMSG